ncbi:LuxR C-terminal-related transcriptional regulator [Rhodoligotrophos defluvii]|uniref:LuxR C-terminal-related transcriptional regulator n=1 Tax=Rhodoligotrophos defluvii TaxID=2561934 RepID=UPI0010C9DE5E|nr:response regulator transcription factor [Rhodoligotrophos defluvii]
MASPQSPISVVIADDHPLVLRALQDILSQEPGFALAGCASSGDQALALICDTRPDIAVLDLTMPGKSGLEILRTMNLSSLPVRVVFLTATITDGQIIEAVAGGVYGILRKESAPEQLVECLREVGEGRKWLPAGLIQPALARETNRRRNLDRFDALTAREAEVVRLLSQGLSNKNIARKLELSEGTVKIHLHNVYRKLNVDSRTALVSIAHKYHSAEHTPET